MSQPVRIAAAAAIVWYALGMPGVSVPGITPSAPYTGRLSALHTAAASMDAGDRATLSAAMEAAGKALAADSRGLVKTTDQAQNYFVAVLEFSYVGMGSPKAKYPAVASALSGEMERVVGTESGALDAAKKSALVEAFNEAGRALK